MNFRLNLHRAALAAALTLGVLAGGAGTAAAANDERFDPAKLTIPPLHPIQKVSPQRSVLANDMVVYLLEDHSLPVVTGRIYFRASSLWAPAERAGLGPLTATVMRSGGSAAKTGDWLDDRLGAIGAYLQSEMNQDYASISFRCLSENGAEVLGLLAEIARRPAFPDDKIELARVGLRRDIASRNDEMFTIAGRVAREAVFGKDHPWSRKAEYATIEAITRDDCIAFHQLCYAPERAILVVVGDFKTADMKKRIAAELGTWPKSGKLPPPLPAIPTDSKPRVVFAPKNDVTQSAAFLAHLGFKAGGPDDAPMDVFEQGFGGGFDSRLFNHIRTQRGLAYATGASAGGGFMRPGIFLAQTLTRNDSVLTALGILREEVQRATREPFGDAETKQARDAVLNSLVFAYERPAQVAFRAAYYELAGLPADYLQTYQKAVAEVTPATMFSAVQRKVHPDQMLAVIVGKESEFEKPLESLGMPVERVDIAIPPPPSKVKAAPAGPEAAATGKQWLAKAAAWAGGAAAFASVKSFTSEATATLSMQGQTIQLGTTSSWRFPDHLHLVQKLPMGEVAQGTDGKTGWRKGFGQIMDQPDVVDGAREDWERSLFHVFGSPDQLEVVALGETKRIGDVECRVALVKSETIRDWQLFFAPDGRLVAMSYQDKGPTGVGTFTSRYDDWKDVGGFKYPHATVIEMEGKPFLDSKLVSAKVNPTLDDSLFAKPAN